MIFVDDRFYKVVVGLALEVEINNRRLNQKLFDIYSHPRLEAIRALHDRLIISADHFDREVAFWLELALEQVPVKIDLKDLILELREMEVLLYDLLFRVEVASQRDFNDWLNHISNVPQSIQDGFVIDAKILMSLAVQCSVKDSIGKNKRNPSLGYKIEILQRETLRLFEEIKRFPLKLAIPEERLNILIELGGILIEILEKYCLEHLGKEVEGVIRYPIQKLETSQRYLMKSDVGLDKVKEEMMLAYEHLDSRVGQVTDGNALRWVKDMQERIRVLTTKLP